MRTSALVRGTHIEPGQSATFLKMIDGPMRKDPDAFSDSDWDVYRSLQHWAEATVDRLGGVVATTDQTLSSVTVGDVPGEQTTVSVPEAAARLGLKRQAVLGRIARGTLPAERDGRGHWRINVEDLEAS
jgi:excisionase family DNA binding protein